ncbi:MAG: type IV secretion system DNA-binding domain-containing protein [Holosporales bacterium]|nr:type IV secretion system DNA-binding domain-containing protein [Holosporales bacterium]
MDVFHNITRGGQTNIHFISMLRQVMKFGMLCSLLIGIIFYATKTYHEVPKPYWQSYAKYYSHELNPFLLFVIEDKTTLHRLPQVLKMVAKVNSVLEKNIPYGFKSFLISFSLILLSWLVMGTRQRQKKHNRGNKALTPFKLKWLIKFKREASDLKVGRLPLIKDKETSHILITGTTGSGKSNCFNILLPQVRKRTNKAIVVDLTGQYISRFYQQGDLILNPFDIRSVNWNPWADCTLVSHYDMLASGLIPLQKYISDRFWDNASRSLFSTAMQKLASLKNYSIHELHRILITTDLNEFECFFKETEAASYTSKEGEKMTLSVRSNLAVQIKSLKYLNDHNKNFSLRQWVQNEEQKNWLFITARPDQRETLKPLISCWLEIAFNAVMSLSPDQQRRLWFMIDELPALQHLPSLPLALAELRKYGGCIMAGIQGMPQISDLYGHAGSQAILDLFNTFIFFRSTDPQTTSWISKVLGEKDETEIIENLSYGANTIRDGVSLNQQTNTKPIVIPTEIQNLRDLEAYIKLPGNYPITKLKMLYQPQPSSKIEIFDFSLARGADHV